VPEAREADAIRAAGLRDHVARDLDEPQRVALAFVLGLRELSRRLRALVEQLRAGRGRYPAGGVS